ncbi:MAG TPA: hypothetical protein VE685_01455 [Thermoanaerobaculia bacterium]|nr:hypothetical protein [Thermoanaerobaculia bacterium]
MEELDLPRLGEKHGAVAMGRPAEQHDPGIPQDLLQGLEIGEVPILR